jgi:hypothetical protein
VADDRPKTSVGRIVVAVAGLIIGLLLLNFGLNLIGEDNEPVRPTGGSTTGATSGATRGSTPGSAAGSVPPATTTR